MHDARSDDPIEAVVLDMAGSAVNVPIGYAGCTRTARSKMTGVASYRSRHLGDELHWKGSNDPPRTSAVSSRTVLVALQRKPARARGKTPKRGAFGGWLPSDNQARDAAEMC